MEKMEGKVIPIAIEDEVKKSYLNYAMSVIVSRALPDVRDGLKPVHRRILYTMSEMGLRHDRSFKKCGRIVGDVLGKFHPHGDQSIYDALVRLAQDFSLRYPVVRPQGNFGSIDGDPPAAMRYTEAKMQAIAEEMLRDIKKETVDFVPNYDDSMLEPSVLPAAFPFLMVNGASGIAVGMATNLAPHNLGEIGNAICAYIDNPSIEVEGLMEHVSGPDFPTGGIIYGKKGLEDAFKTGRGKVTIRAKSTMEVTKDGRDVIVITEIPYTVNKANLIVKIADLVKNKKIEGISDLRDESDRNGMRIVIELKRTAIPKVVLNRLYSKTALQHNFNINNLALVDGMPKLLNLRDMVHYFVRHRVDVVTRRAQYELAKAKARAHILEGLKIALDNIDEVIKIIKESKDTPTAKVSLMKTFGLSEIQSQAILDMRLQKLTGLETQRIIDELQEVLAYIAYLEELLASEVKIMGVVKDETIEIVEKFGDDRKSAIIRSEVDQINIEDLIQEEDVAVLFTSKGFVKRVPLSMYRSQGRGGTGSNTAKLKDEDFVKNIFIASTHEYIVFTTNEGKAYSIKVYEIPEAGRQAKGTHIKALLALSVDEEVAAVVSVPSFDESSYILMATAKGVIKRTLANKYINAKTRGVIAVKLKPGDRLVSALYTQGEGDLLAVTRKGYALRFHEDAIRPTGRNSMGVSGMKLRPGDEICNVLTVTGAEFFFILTENGYGKRVRYDVFTPHGRNTLGQICYKTNEKTGEVIAALAMDEDSDVMCITSKGRAIKMDACDVSLQGKNAGGVTVVRLKKPDMLISAASCPKVDEVLETEEQQV